MLCVCAAAHCLCHLWFFAFLCSEHFCNRPRNYTHINKKKKDGKSNNSISLFQLRLLLLLPIQNSYVLLAQVILLNSPLYSKCWHFSIIQFFNSLHNAIADDFSNISLLPAFSPVKTKCSTNQKIYLRCLWFFSLLFVVWLFSFNKKPFALLRLPL